jgi:CheY-like chemotaxis protein
MARPLEGVRVLLVDDEPDSAETVAFLLVQGGAQVFAVSNAPEALVRSARFKPHVLVTDIAMPMMDGYQLVRAFRSAGETFPVVAISGHAEQRYIRQAKEAGFAAYLVKPIEPARLIATILDVLKPPQEPPA